MLDTPQIIQTAAQITAVIHIVVAREDIQKVMGPGIDELRSALAAQGIAPAGPLFTHHFRRSTDSFDFEIGLPVAAPVTTADRMKAGQLPAATVARTIYHGAYEGLGAAWGEFHTWITSQGRTPGTDFWEAYLAGPESGKDPAGWRTELNCPLTD